MQEFYKLMSYLIDDYFYTNTCIKMYSSRENSTEIDKQNMLIAINKLDVIKTSLKLLGFVPDNSKIYLGDVIITENKNKILDYDKTYILVNNDCSYTIERNNQSKKVETLQQAFDEVFYE